MEQEIDKKWLTGLRISGAERKAGADGGGWVQTDRPMKPKDVLSFRETDEEMIIVACDGKKHRVSKKPVKAGADQGADQSQDGGAAQ